MCGEDRLLTLLVLVNFSEFQFFTKIKLLGTIVARVCLTTLFRKSLKFVHTKMHRKAKKLNFVPANKHNLKVVR